MVNYQNSKIYKVINSVNDNVYIGSTAVSLSYRMGDHRLKTRRGKFKEGSLQYHMNNLGIDKFKIILIENYPCDTKEELKKREQYFINEMKPAYNLMDAYLDDETRAMKKKKCQYAYHQKNKDKAKEYREKNKEKIAERYKTYSQTEKAKKSKAESNAIYKQNNKEKINARRNESYECSCGSTMRRDEKARHERSKKHQEYVNNISV